MEQTRSARRMPEDDIWELYREIGDQFTWEETSRIARQEEKRAQEALRAQRLTAEEARQAERRFSAAAAHSPHSKPRRKQYRLRTWVTDLLAWLVLAAVGIAVGYMLGTAIGDGACWLLSRGWEKPEPPAVVLPADLELPESRSLEELAEQHRTALQTICGDEWQTLTEDQRLAALTEAAQLTCDWLGVENVPTLEAEEMKSTRLGCYRHKDNLIQLNRQRLMADDGRDALDTVLHEVHHCYTWHLAEAYAALPEAYRKLQAYRTEAVYLQELTHYTTAEEDFQAYRNQSVEADARRFAGWFASALEEMSEEDARQ